MSASGSFVVLDTNVVLDMLLFGDPGVRGLQADLASGRVGWLATRAMRAEMERVLAYPHLVDQLAARGGSAAEVMAAFDAQTTCVDAAPRAGVVCADPDDQVFVDLAVHHGCVLISKDKAVLALAARWPAGAQPPARYGGPAGPTDRTGPPAQPSSST